MGGTEPAQGPLNERRFEEFFVEDSYVALKNYLYNYLERKRAINRALDGETGLLLEVGSGLSPIVTGRNNVVYSELSFTALRTLKRLHVKGHYVVADGTHLPFASSSLSHVVCSEVLEHVEDDRAAIGELARVLDGGGRAYITVPHRMFYFAADDRYVHHFRRYEIAEMTEKLREAGLRVHSIRKVLGPLEKVTMFTVVMLFSALHNLLGSRGPRQSGPTAMGAVMHAVVRPIFKWAHRGYAVLARLDAWVMPRSLATVILFETVKE